MLIRKELTPAQWLVLRAAPWAVGLYVATAVGGKVQEVRELLALGGALRRALERDRERDLVGAVAADILGAGLTPAGLRLPSGDRPALLRAVAAAGDSARALPGGPEYLRWLMGLAREVAAAEQDRDFLGLGAEAVHTAEQIALAEVVEALGLNEG
jgi:hypothetical protein